MDDAWPVVGHLPPGWQDFFIVIGAILLVLLCVVFWAMFLRKNGETRRKRRRKRHDRPGSYRERFQKSTKDIKQLLNEHQHRRRREKYAANPTLAQTGGLPPVREEKKPDGTSPP